MSPAPATTDDATPAAEKPRFELATFGGGCFWCTEAIYERIAGVESVVSGYSGGTVPNPTYKQVCTGTTGHAECIHIRFDPKKVGYLKLLQVFFATHDPTTKNRQGADVGTQYRSVIFWHDEKQRDIAKKLVKALDASEAYPAPIVTEIAKFTAFYPAEDSHQGYFDQNPRQGYCRVVIQPKVEKFEKVFAAILKEKPAKDGDAAPAGEPEPAPAEPASDEAKDGD